MTESADMPRAQLREQLREALLGRLQAAEGGRSTGAELVRDVALEVDVDPSRVVAALWTLVEDGRVTYEPGAELQTAAG